MAIDATFQSVKKVKAGKVLSPQERKACEQISAGEGLFSQRAQALLLIDEGASQVAAGERSGLTRGQVNYWLDKFRRDGMAIFPEALYDESEFAGEPAVSQVDAAMPKARQEKTRKKKKKAKKGKKRKKNAKGKKAKRAKKSKKKSRKSKK